MKRKLLYKCYKNKHECESVIKKLKTTIFASDINDTDGVEMLSNRKGRIKELEQNIIFIEELIDIIMEV